jgi:acyl-homoserine lactone acylase PvdQ
MGITHDLLDFRDSLVRNMEDHGAPWNTKPARWEWEEITFAYESAHFGPDLASFGKRG